MSEMGPLEAETGDGSPTIEVVVYQHGREIHRELCETAEAADEIASSWSELPGVECQVDDLATRHHPGEILEPDEGPGPLDEDYPRP